jgi:hypothetical protein
MSYRKTLTVLWALLTAGTLGAAELEGSIESVNLDRKSFVVEGITFFVTETTEFAGGLEGFIDLVRGLEVEVDFEFENGRHVATAIEPGD